MGEIRNLASELFLEMNGWTDGLPDLSKPE